MTKNAHGTETVNIIAGNRNANEMGTLLCSLLNMHTYTCAAHTQRVLQTFPSEDLRLASSKRSVDPVPLLTGVSGIMELGREGGRGERGMGVIVIGQN